MAPLVALDVLDLVLAGEELHGVGDEVVLRLGPFFAGRDELARLEDDNRDKDRLIAVKRKEKQQVERFRFMSRRIAKGSRIRLVIRSPNSIQLQKNYNSGGEVSRETARDARTAHVRLYHDPGHWSALEIPVADSRP